MMPLATVGLNSLIPPAANGLEPAAAVNGLDPEADAKGLGAPAPAPPDGGA